MMMRSPKHRRTKPNSSSDDVSIPTLPDDVIPEILSRLPVKYLLQFRCVSKSWKSLISDPIFARNHLNLSTTRHLLHPSYEKASPRYILNYYPLQPIFTTDYNNNFTRFQFPPDDICQRERALSRYNIVGSCDGILCVANNIGSLYFKPLVVLWNLSIRKFKELPPFANPPEVNRLGMKYAFGYDHVSHDYKVVVIYSLIGDTGILLDTTEVKVYTLSTDSWRTIPPFPFDTVADRHLQGRYLSGSNSINWMAFSKHNREQCCIISFDLGNESYQMIGLPPLPESSSRLRFCVLRDWLCIICDHDVWVMKEYGIQESWTKLFNVTHLLDPPYKSFYLIHLLYLFQDDQLLLLFHKANQRRLILYNYKNDTSKVSFMLDRILKNDTSNSKVRFMMQCIPEVCVESLISPCL